MFTRHELSILQQQRPTATASIVKWNWRASVQLLVVCLAVATDKAETKATRKNELLLRTILASWIHRMWTTKYWLPFSSFIFVSMYSRPVSSETYEASKHNQTHCRDEKFSLLVISLVNSSAIFVASCATTKLMCPLCIVWMGCIHLTSIVHKFTINVASQGLIDNDFQLLGQRTTLLLLLSLSLRRLFDVELRLLIWSIGLKTNLN